ncbi:hypothetical protein F5148DRAFT_415117 [Russula earlei]|uniref:Uncharacterized protein n=1 Tax=Russula earlei TaxID=71964 RepID=A0ACC0U102_9AGAM|nr:hypothetical protein F5148DRAFT_415117 [Russula earlei]
MSSIEQTTTSFNFQLIVDALVDYTEKTEREKAFKEYRNRNRTLINCLSPAVNVLHAFSSTLSEAVVLVPFPPAKAIFVGIDVLLAAASGVSSSYDALLDLFDYLGNFLKRLEIYTNIPPTSLMTDMIVKIMVKLLAVLGLATKQIKHGRIVKFAKKLLGETEVEAVLQRLDRLSQEEARMTVAQTLGVVHGLMARPPQTTFDSI